MGTNKACPLAKRPLSVCRFQRGDDIQPAWLANSWSWAQELRVRLQRQVHLELINEPSARVEASCDIASASITEISWRDASRDTD